MRQHRHRRGELSMPLHRATAGSGCTGNRAPSRSSCWHQPHGGEEKDEVRVVPARPHIHPCPSTSTPPPTAVPRWLDRHEGVSPQIWPSTTASTTASGRPVL